MQGLDPIHRLVVADLPSRQLDPAGMAGESPDRSKDSAAPSSSSAGGSGGGGGGGVGGTLRWIWSGVRGMLFGRSIDFQKRLQHLSKEEVAVHSRMKRRTHTWRRLARAIVLYSVIIEVLALGFALVSTRSLDIPWKLRAIRVAPVFAVPALAALLYTTCSRYYHMRERIDQRTLEKLRAERQARIDELKQKTNYYATQQLIQQYDLDPTAKAAAASVLAAKLGAESGLNVAFKAPEGSESSSGTPPGRTRTPESASGLRQRRTTPQPKEAFGDQGFLKALEDEVRGERETEAMDRDAAMERFRGRMGGVAAGAGGAGGGGGGGGWLSRIAAMLVGEDPSQCYALICKNCHTHNGLAPKEEFQYVTYICPHCRTLNGGQQLQSAEAEQQQQQQQHNAAAEIAAVAAAAAAAATAGVTSSSDSKQEGLFTAAQDDELDNAASS